MAKTVLDLMEYSSDANAQAAYVSNDSAVASAYPTQDTNHVKATSYYDGSFAPWLATDPSKSLTGAHSGNSWLSNWGSPSNQRFHIDLGTAIIVTKIYYENWHDSGSDVNKGIKNYTFWGSNSASAFAELTYGTDTDWTQLTVDDSQFDAHTGSNVADPKYVNVTNSTPYRYYAIKVADCWGDGNAMGVRRIELQGAGSILRCGSESTIKTQGSYSLRGVATTGASSKTLTRTIGSPIDLSNINLIKFSIYSNRTGSNIKIGIHDSGGTTTEITPNISSAGEQQTVSWDISAVSNANKDAIDKIIITIVNADSANIFYVDDMNGIPVPIVTTQAVSSIDITTATGNGTITDLSGETATDRGFKYGLTETDTWDAHDTGSYGEAAFTKGITGLSALKTYYVRAYATSPAGTGYGEYVSFTTLDKAISTSQYQIELRDKNGNLKQYLTPYASKVNWEWNRIGGCGRCSITISKAYRDVTFDIRDDIQIRIKSGTTSKLVYRGYIANIVPTLKVNQDIVLDVRGYFDLLKKLVIHTTGDTRTYTSKTVAFIADDIADTFIVPNSPITISGAITAGDFTADSIEFLCTVEDALRTLSELQGDIEYGVDENLVFYWVTESEVINNKFFVGNNISVLERRVNWDDLVNKLYLVGGDVAGVKYKKTAEDTDSQAVYGLSEEILNNSSITTDSVAAQYMNAILVERSIPKFSIRATVKNSDLRLEDTVPMGLVVFYDAKYDRDTLGDSVGDIIGEAADGGSDITIGLLADGGSDVLIGGQYSAQVDRVSYSLSNTPGRFNLEIQLGDTVLETAAKIKRLELALNSITQGA